MSAKADFDDSLDDRMVSGPVDYMFRCNYCVKVIGQDEPIYMGHDCTYCSTKCRSRGKSALYNQLRLLQLERLKTSEPDTVTTVLSNAKSGSSLTSSRCTPGQGRRGPVTWVLRKVFGVISSHLPVEPIVRTASALMLQHLRPGSSLHGLLSQMSQGQSFLGFGESPVPSSGHSR